MKAIKCDLPSNISMLELHTFADEHIGDEHSDIERIKKRIQYVAEHKNAYCVLNGDILDYASRSSIGDIETREFNIMGQLEKAVELFEPIKDKILCINSGNHEARGYRKEGFDISKVIAMQLGISDKYLRPVRSYSYGLDRHQDIHITDRRDTPYISITVPAEEEKREPRQSGLQTWQVL